MNIEDCPCRDKTVAAINAISAEYWHEVKGILKDCREDHQHLVKDEIVKIFDRFNLLLDRE